MDVTKAAKGAIFVFLATFVGLGINYFYGLLIARWLGASLYGQFSLGLTIFNILSLLSVFGMDNAVLKHMPECKQSRPLNKDSLIKASLLIGGGVSICLSLALYLSADYLSDQLFEAPSLGVILKGFAFAIPAYAFISIMIAVMQSKHNVYWRITVKYFSEPIIRIAVTFFLLSIGFGVSATLFGYVSALWISVFLCLYWIMKYFSIFKINSNEVGNIKTTTNVLLRYSSPLIIGMVFVNFASRSDVLLIGYFLSTFDVGIYAAALQTSAIIAIVLQSVESIVAPHLSEALSSKNTNKIREVYSLALRWVVIIGLPLFVLFIMFAETILSLYGEDFISATAVFVVLSVGSFINLVTGSANYVLLFLGKTKLVMLNQFFHAAMLVFLNVLLINQYGILGAAISMVVATLVANLIRVYQVFKLTGTHPYERYLIKPVIAGLVMIVSISLFETIGVESFILQVILSVLLYLITVFFLGLNKDDREAGVNMLAVLRKRF